jgi:hypothetical protein
VKGRAFSREAKREPLRFPDSDPRSSGREAQGHRASTVGMGEGRTLRITPRFASRHTQALLKS